MLTSSDRSNAQRVLDFWFAVGTSEFDLPRQAWWLRDERFDASIRDQFGELHHRASLGELGAWSSEAGTCLALVIVLDQFSRNLYRGSPRTYALDPVARELATAAIDKGFDKALPPIRAQFFYLPLMHSENMGDQSRCVALFEGLAGLPDQEKSISYARRHAEIVNRFGRFPHRNAVLGRVSSESELEFLSGPNSSF